MMTCRTPSRLFAAAGIAVLAGLASARPAGAQAGAQPPERPDVDLPFYYMPDSSHLSIPVHVWGRDSLWMVVDNGAQHQVVLPAARTAFGSVLSVSGPTTVNGASGQDAAEAASIDSLRVGTVTLRGLTATVYDFLHVIHEPPTAPPLAGILGRDVLRDYDIEFDFPAGRIRWYSAPAVETTTGRHAPTRWAERPGYVCVPNVGNVGDDSTGDVMFEMKVNDVPTYGYFDSGSGRTTIGALLAADLDLAPSSGEAPASIGTGIGPDKHPFYWAKGLELSVGGTTLRNARVVYGQVRMPSVPAQAPPPGLLLGLSSVNDRVFVLAYRTNEVCFGPRVSQKKGTR